jgi:malonyl-CoA O-methyltransferase
MSGHGVRPVDLLALERARRRLSSVPQVPWLHGEVARRMADRLSIVRITPQTVLDWGGPSGGAAQLLAGAYPSSRRVSVGHAPQAIQEARARPKWKLFPWLGSSLANPWVAEDAVVQGGAGLVWSNMALHAQPDPGAMMQRWHRALGVGGFLMFSTFGAGTLPELREIYAEQGWGSPAGALVDMHDLGDMLVEVGFADPVMDQETIQLTWPDARSALSELRGLGANVDPVRHRGLRTPRWRDRLFQALHRQSRQRADGRVCLSFEAVYGHAFRVAARPRVAAVTKVDLEDMRDMTRTTRR